MDEIPLSKATTKEQRILLRKERMKQRRNKEDSKNKEAALHKEVAKTSVSAIQVEQSRIAIDGVKSEGYSQVTSVRLDAYGRESQRRIEEEIRNAARVQMVEEEADINAQKNEEIEMKWLELQGSIIPQDLQKEIYAQQAACSEIMTLKNDLINEFQEELSEKNESYVKLLHQQSEDIQKLLDRMHKQFELLQETYDAEAQRIAVAFREEGKSIKTSNRKEIDALFEKRHSAELQMLDSKLNREEMFSKNLEEVRLNQTEEYSKLKMNLENNIQLLEQQLEEMRATYQLNAEKLEYNFRLLQERSDENRETVFNQNTRLKRCKEQLSKLKEKYTAQENKFRTDNAKLTDEYTRITEQFKDLQTKYRHFEAVDSNKYSAIWSMHEEKVKSLVQDVLKASNQIHESILRTPAPVIPYDYFSISYPVPWTETSLIQDLGWQAVENSEKKSADHDTSKARRSSMGNVHSRTKKYSSAQVNKVKDLLFSEASFLADASVMSSDKDTIVQSILSAMGVRDKEGMDALMARFFVNANGEEDAEPIIHPNDTVKVVRQYVLDRSNNVENESTKTGNPDAVSKESRDVVRSKEHDFWKRLAYAVSDREFRTWGALETALHKYNNILEQRHKSLQEAMSLQKQNEELKNVLKKHLTSDENHLLMIPPSQVIRLESKSNVKDNETQRKVQPQTHANLHPKFRPAIQKN